MTGWRAPGRARVGPDSRLGARTDRQRAAAGDPGGRARRIVDPRRGRARPATAAEPTAATPRVPLRPPPPPSGGPRRNGGRRSSRRGGAVLLGLGAAVVLGVIAVLIFVVLRQQRDQAQQLPSPPHARTTSPTTLDRPPRRRDRARSTCSRPPRAARPPGSPRWSRSGPTRGIVLVRPAHPAQQEQTSTPSGSTTRRASTRSSATSTRESGPTASFRPPDPCPPTPPSTASSSWRSRPSPSPSRPDRSSSRAS